ncbi:MAG: hypothetical protein CFH23_00299, partial [Alphaproteobacteria bacterium MarineAlpha6_Bin1]
MKKIKSYVSLVLKVYHFKPTEYVKPPSLIFRSSSILSQR